MSNNSLDDILSQPSESVGDAEAKAVESFKDTQRAEDKTESYSPEKSAVEQPGLIDNASKGVEGDQGFFENLGDQVVENTSLGNFFRMIGTRDQGQKDPNFDPDKMMPELKKYLHTGLDTADQQYLYNNFSFNETTYRNAAILLKDTKERRKRVIEFATKNPISGMSNMMLSYTFLEPLNYVDGAAVVGGMNAARKAYLMSKATKTTLSSILDKDTFTAVTAAAKAARLSPGASAKTADVVFDILSKKSSWKIADPTNMKTFMGGVVAGESISQGAVEFLRAYDKDEDFDMSSYAFGILVGTGVSTAIPLARSTNAYQNTHNFLSKYLDDLKRLRVGIEPGTEGRFYSNPFPVYFASKDADKFLNTVAEQADNEKAFELASLLKAERESIVEGWKDTKKADYSLMEKNFERTSEHLSILKKKGKLTKEDQNTLRLLKKEKAKLEDNLKTFRKKYDDELLTVESGKHPLFTSNYKGDTTPEYYASKIEGLNPEDIRGDEKLAYFLGFRKPVNFEIGFAKMSPTKRAIVDRARDTIGNERLSSQYVLNKAMDYIDNPEHMISKLNFKFKDKRFTDYFRDYVTNPDSLFSKYFFTVNSQYYSDNNTISGLVDLILPANLGREGMNLPSAVQVKSKYLNDWNGTINRAFNDARGAFESAYTSPTSRLRDQFINYNNVEENFVQMLSKSHDMPQDQFVKQFGQDMWDVSQKFRDELFKVSKSVEDSHKKLGVKGSENFSAMENGRHVQWDMSKFRQFGEKSVDSPGRFVPKKAFVEQIKESLKSGLIKMGKELSEDELQKIAYQWCNGMVNLEWSQVELATVNTMKSLEKLAKDTAGTEAGEVVQEALAVEIAKAEKFFKKEMNQRTPLDMNMELEGRPLNEYMDGNYIATQKQWLNRQASKSALAEMGILDMDSMDEILEDVRLEAQELARSKNLDLDQTQDYVKKHEEVAKDLIDEFRYGVSIEKNKAKFKGNVNDLYKFMANATEAAMLPSSSIKSIAELGIVVANTGATRFLSDVAPSLYKNYKAFYKGDAEILDRLTRDIRILGSHGDNDFLNNTVGYLKEQKRYNGGPLGHFETLVNATKNLTARVIQPVEKSVRLVAAKYYTMSLHEHYSGISNNIFDDIFGSSKITSAAFENLGLGRYVDGKIEFNDDYYKLKDIFTNKVDTDEKGILIGFKELTADEKDLYNRVIGQQMFNTLVEPDMGSMHEIQKYPIGSLLYQFMSYSINASQKVAGHYVANAVKGASRGELTDSFKWAQGLFWTSALGFMVNSALNLERDLGKDKNSKSFRRYNEQAIPTFAIGLMNSPYIEHGLGIVNTTANLFGIDTFNSGYSTDFKDSFNLLNTPTGQLGLNAVNTGINFTKAVTGNDPQGNAWAKTTKGLIDILPMRRVPGFRAGFNFLTPNTDPVNTGNDD